MKTIKWSKEEDDILRKHYASMVFEYLRQLLPGRTIDAIQHRACRLHLKPKKKVWSDRDLATLIRLWPTATKEIIQVNLPNFAWSGIKTKASILGLKKQKVERRIKSDTLYKSNLLIKTGDKFRFGVVSDTHFGSKYAQISWLHKVYEKFNKEGIETVFHAGDLSEGNGTHYRGQIFEMHITGADALKKFIVKNYPQLKKGTTHIIAGGHDLDLWKREGYDILQNVCNKRKDLNYLGQVSAYYIFGKRKIYLSHPSGGTAYSVSYRPQKLVESFSSENKPHIVVIGHYHKAEFLPLLRNVYVIQAGCLQGQTPFAAQRALQWHYGSWIIEMTVSKSGISDMKVEFIPFYKPIVDDYKYYI